MLSHAQAVSQFTNRNRLIRIFGGLALLASSSISYGQAPMVANVKGPFGLEGLNYAQMINDLDDDNCVPAVVNKVSNVEISLLHCSDDALEDDGEGEQITSNFTIPDELARRVNFWHRIYTMWTSDDFVMHSAEYPEVVLEVGKYMDPNAPEGLKVKSVKRVLQDRQRKYAKILMMMHYNRNAQSFEFDPIMRRIAKMMAHIDNPNKYKIVANSLRTQRGQRNFIEKGITYSSRYLPIIESEFVKRGIPPELARIAFVESSFNIKAVSKVGASGVYQFMRFSAKPNLIVDDVIDERRDPIKAGIAAAKMFQANYQILQNWPLAVTAYNHGPYSLQKAVRRLGSTDLTYLINHYDNSAFGFASKNFYTEFLAILATYEDRSKHFPNALIEKPIAFKEMKLTKSQSIASLRKQLKVSAEALAELNPDIERRHIIRGGMLPRGFVLKLPMDEPTNPTAMNEPLRDADL